MPRLSVIIPVRNGASTIRTALASVLRSLPADASVTVLDDGSTDETPGLLHEMAHPKLSVLTSTEGMGVARGLNHLLQHTDSDYVARMDADDIVLPWRFMLQQRHLQHTRTDVTFTTVTLLRGRSLRLTRPKQIPADAFPLHLLVTNPVAHPTMYARRAAIERVGGYREVPSEDYDLWLRMALAGISLSRSGAPGLLYRIHGKQVTASQEWRQASWSDSQIQEVYRDLSEHILGNRLSRLLSLASDPDMTRARLDEHIHTLVEAIDSACHGLRPKDRQYLHQTLGSRLAHANDVFAKSSSSGSPEE